MEQDTPRPRSNVGFAFDAATMKKLRELVEELRITQNACVTLAIHELWDEKVRRPRQKEAN